jgi:hypothetical protein
MRNARRVVAVAHVNLHFQSRLGVPGMPTIKERAGSYFLPSCECGAPKVLLCFMHCWRAVERRQAKAYCFVVVASAEECSSMRVHIDGKPPDGNAIAFVVIILLSVVALEVLFSRLDTFL